MKKNSCVSAKFTANELQFLQRLSPDYESATHRRTLGLRILNIVLILGIVGTIVIFAAAI